jgi:anaerobic C4-dicarboxylate transporter
MESLSSQNFMSLLPVIIPAAVIIILAVAFIPHFLKLRSDLHAGERLRQSGIKKRAKILQMIDMSLTSPDDTQIIIVVEVMQGVRTKLVTTSARMSPPKVGDTIEVLYDPKDPQVAVLP